MARKSPAAIKNDITRLSLKQAKDLQGWLAAHVAELERQAEEWEPPVDGDTVAVERDGSSCYILQGVKCGKAGCKCGKGSLHGPYWYEYRRIDGKLKKKYHGKARGSSKFGDRQPVASEEPPVEVESDRGYSQGQSLEVLKEPYSGLKSWEFLSVVEGGHLDGWVECYSGEMGGARKFHPKDVRSAA